VRGKKSKWSLRESEKNANSRIPLRIQDNIVLFSDDDRLIGSRDPVWLQQALDCLIKLFERVGLKTNASKTKVMTCVPGYISTHISSPARALLTGTA